MWHLEYGANYNAMAKSQRTLLDMELTDREELLALEIYDWMERMVMEKDYWF